jgi:hypothetical protein
MVFGAVFVQECMCLLFVVDSYQNRQVQLEEEGQLENALPSSSNPIGSVKRGLFSAVF